jgi:hypothetical protein
MLAMNESPAESSRAAANRGRETSPFLRLPAELRNPIYEMLLHHNHGIRIDEDWGMVNPPSNFLAITEVCRQVHVETRILPYSINMFVVDLEFISWLRFLDDDRREAITSIELSFTMLMRIDYPGGSWYSDPVRQNENFIAMVLLTLPGLNHVNLAGRIELYTPVYADGTVITTAPGPDDIQRWLEPFRLSFEQSTTGVQVTTTTNTEGLLTQRDGS